MIVISDEDIKNFNQDLAGKQKSLEEVTSKLDLALVEINETQQKLQVAQDNVVKLQDRNKQLDNDWKNFKIQRDQAVDEKESLLQMVERRNSEVASLKIDLNNLNKQLQTAVKAKMVALENCEEVESLKISLSYK